MAAAAIPYLAAGGGAALGILGDQRASDERRGIVNSSLQRTQQNQKKATQSVLDEAQRYSPDQRKKAFQTQEDQTYAQSQKDLSGAGAGTIDTAGDAGAVSGDFLKAKADAALSENQRLSSVARELAKVRAPGQVMTNEAQSRADLTGQLGSMWNTDRNLSNAAQLDADNVETPIYGQLGKLASQIGIGLAAGQIGKTKNLKAPSTTGQFARLDRGQINWE